MCYGNFGWDAWIKGGGGVLWGIWMDEMDEDVGLIVGMVMGIGIWD